MNREMSPTDQELETIYSLYKGQPAAVDHPNYKNDSVIVSMEDGKVRIRHKTEGYDSLASTKVKIELRSLKNIYPQHMNAIGKMMIGDEHIKLNIGRSNLEKGLFIFDHKTSPTGYSYIDIFFEDSNIEAGIINPDKPRDRIDDHVANITALQVYDLLRGWGYMIHYNGLDLFEIGVAIQVN